MAAMLERAPKELSEVTGTRPQATYLGHTENLIKIGNKTATILDKAFTCFRIYQVRRL